MVVPLVRLLAGLVATASVLAMPGVAAQSLGASLELEVVESPATPLVPNGATQQVVVAWTYQMDAGAAAGAVGASNATVEFDALGCESPGFMVTGTTTHRIVLDPARSEYSGNATFHVAATGDARGEMPVDCRFTARVPSWWIGVEDTDDAAVNVSVSAAFVGVVSFAMEDTIGEAAPGEEVRFPFRLTNRGNAPTVVRFSVPADAEWDLIPPPEVTLQRSGEEGAAADAAFVIVAPTGAGWVNMEKTFTLGIHPASASDPAVLGQAVSVNVLVHVRGVAPGDGETSAPLGPAALAGVLGAVAVARRRKE